MGEKVNGLINLSLSVNDDSVKDNNVREKTMSPFGLEPAIRYVKIYQRNLHITARGTT